MILGISTTNVEYEVVIGENNQVLFSSRSDYHSDENKTDISKMITAGTEKLGITLQDVKSIMVNNGPGPTTRIRTGVAFANSLSYGLNVPVVPVPSLELFGMENWDKYQLPVLCSLRSIKDTAYMGLFHDGKLTMKYGKFIEIAQELAREIEAFIFAGYVFKNVENLNDILPNKKITTSDIQAVNAELLITKSDIFKNRAIQFPNITHPITEQNIETFS